MRPFSRSQTERDVCGPARGAGREASAASPMWAEVAGAVIGDAVGHRSGPAMRGDVGLSLAIQRGRCHAD